MATQRAQDIYVPLIFPKGHGYPLWLPDPHSNLPPVYLSRGTQIGDLGYLADDGGFAYLFNVCKDASDPVNLNRVPPGFIPLTGIPDPGVRERLEMHDKNSAITTAAVEQRSIELDVSAQGPSVPTAFGAGGGFEFTSSSSQGAVLVLPDGGERYDSEYSGLFEEYAIANAHSWYKYLNGPGQRRQIRNGMLYLVTGCDKCRSWGNACYSHPTQSSRASLKFLATGVAEVSGTLCYRWEVQSGVHKRSHHRDMASGVMANQTIFLRGYSISVREPSALRALLGVQTVNTFKSDVSSSKPPSFGAKAPYAAEQSKMTRITGTSDLKLAKRSAGGPPSDDDDLVDYSDKLVIFDDVKSEAGEPTIDIPYGNTTRQADTSLKQVPDRGKIINPSALINYYILDNYYDADVVLTHDSYPWMGMINNDVHKPLDAVKLANYAIGNDLVFINRSLGANNAWVAKADTLSSLARSKYNIFALIIGVDKYASLIYKNLDGASSDADRFEAYLLEDLRTPKEHIISFRDGQATRSAIIDELINMKYNSDIQPNTTAIVIYFAGYGAITTKPVEWIDWKTPYNHIGMLCPTDIGILDENGDVIHGIPDRTINQLLLELSSVKGNNITLILDCCYAVDSSDQPKPADMPTAKPRQIFNPPKLLSNCDQKIYSRAEKSVARFGSSHSDSHILLTACKHYQSAYESQGEGLFTRALLKVLREWPKGELTYKSLIHHLDTPACQTPLLEGNRIDRYLFDSGDTVNGCRILCYSEKDQPYLSLHAGSLHGIRAGSIFKIYRTDLSDGRRRLTVATAVKVEAFVSFLKPADQFILTAYGNHRVWYAQFVGVSAPRFTIYCNDSNFLARILDEEVGSRLVDPPSPVDDLQQADLCLTVDGNSVLFDRGNRTSIVSPIMGLPSRFSHISTVDTVSQIRNIIECYACFTSRITMSNRLPISRLVSVEMRVILDLQPRSNNLLPDAIDKPIEPIELVSDSSDFYGFITVYNTSDIDLYVSLCHFDASTLAIDMPQAFTRLTSRKTSVTYCNKKFRLNIPEDQDVNVHFLKLFVAKRCIVIDGFCQPSPFSGVPVKHGAGVPLISNSEEWASMIISVVVRRPKLDSTQKLSSYLDEKLGKGIFPTKRGKEGRKEGSFIT